MEQSDQKYLNRSYKKRKYYSHSKNVEAESMKNKGNHYFKTKKFYEAIECFSQAIKLDPKCAAYYCNRSIVYYHNGEFNSCIEDASVAIKIDPFYGTAWLYLGKCHRHILLCEISIKCLNRVRLLDPFNITLDEELYKAYILNESFAMYINSVKIGNNLKKEMSLNHITEITRNDISNSYFKNDELKLNYILLDAVIIERLIKLLCLKGMTSYAKVEARYLIHRINNKKKFEAWLSYLLGFCYYLEDNEEEVLANFRKFIKQPDPLNIFSDNFAFCTQVEAIYTARRKGNEAYDNCQFDDAIDWYLKEINNKHIIPVVKSNLFCKIGFAKLKQNKDTEALIYLKQAIEDNENNHEAVAVRGEYYMKQKGFKDALENFELANKLHPCDRYAELISVAKLKQSSPLCDDEDIMKKELSLQMSLANCKKEKGNKHFDNNRYEDAINAYTEAIGLDSSNPVYYSNRAACHMMLKNFDNGQKDCEEALKINTSFVKGLYRLSKCHIALGSPEKALTALEKALNINPNDRNLRNEKMKGECLKKEMIDGDIEYDARNYENALQLFSEAIKKAEVFVKLRLKKIDCLIQLEKFEEALTEANLAVSLDQDNSELFYYMGLCHFHNQERDNSIDCLRKSLTLKSEERVSDILKSVENVFKLKDLGDKAYEENRLKEALSYYEEGLKLDAKSKTLNIIFYFNIGKIYMREHEIEKAINYFQSIINIQPDNFEAYKHRAECYLNLNLLEKALQDFEELYKLTPSKEYEILIRETKEKLKSSSKNMTEKELENSLSNCKQEKAKKYFVQKNFKEALESYTEAIHLNSDNVSLYIARSSCFIAMKNYSAALTDAQEALKKNENCVQGLIISGDCHTILGNVEEAICCFEQAKQLDAENKEIVEGIRKALKLKQCLNNAKNALANDRIGRAYDMFKCASRISIGCASILLNVAECLISLQRLPALSKLTESECKLLQECPEYFCIKGLDFYHNDKMSDTIKCLEKALEIDSLNKKCNEYLNKIRSVCDKKQKGNDAFFQRKYDEAVNYYKEGLKMETDNLLIQSKFHYNIGVVLKKQNLFEEAIDRFTRAISIQETYVNALEKRAECFTKMKELDKAVKDYNRLYKITNSIKYLKQKQDLEKQIDDKSAKKDYYKILKVSRDASMDEIRKAYKTLAKEFHPDRLKTEAEKQIGEEKFKEINEAYSVLSDPLKRERYDRGETDAEIPFNFPFDPFMFNPFARAAFFRLFQEDMNNPFFF